MQYAQYAREVMGIKRELASVKQRVDQAGVWPWPWRQLRVARRSLRRFGSLGQAPQTCRLSSQATSGLKAQKAKIVLGLIAVPVRFLLDERSTSVKLTRYCNGLNLLFFWGKEPDPNLLRASTVYKCCTIAPVSRPPLANVAVDGAWRLKVGFPVANSNACRDVMLPSVKGEIEDLVEPAAERQFSL